MDLVSLSSAGDGPNQSAIIACNWAAYSATMVMSYSSTRCMKNSLRAMTDEWNLKIRPAGWAFAIWGIIYMLELAFVIYQTLPSTWVSERNDDMIFTQMNYLFAINKFATALWLPVYQTNTLLGFFFGWLLMVIQLTTGLTLLTIVDANILTWTEVFVVKLPISIYSGWMTVAFILGTA